MAEKNASDLLYEAGDMLTQSRGSIYMDDMSIRMEDGKITFEFKETEPIEFPEMSAFKKKSVGEVIHYFASMLEE